MSLSRSSLSFSLLVLSTVTKEFGGIGRDSAVGLMTVDYRAVFESRWPDYRRGNRVKATVHAS